MIHTTCGVHCNVIRTNQVPQDLTRYTIKAAWLIKCPTCGKEVRRNTKPDVIRSAQAEGFTEQCIVTGKQIGRAHV